jgi:CubicO group peptidase (beta-lactamase class C family)
MESRKTTGGERLSETGFLRSISALHLAATGAMISHGKRWVAPLVVFILLCSARISGTEAKEKTMNYWPTHGWRVGEPEKFGLEPARLHEVKVFSEDKATDALMVIRHGYIVAEWYFDGFTQSRLHNSASIAKSATGILVGIATQEGKIVGLKQAVAEYFPEWRSATTDSRKWRITIEHLLSMTSGLSWDSNEDSQRMRASANWLSYVLERPVAVAPGTRWVYSNGDTTLLSGIVRKATGKSLLTYGREKLFEPLNMRPVEWDQDATGTTDGGAGMSATTRDFSKIGLLYLKRGRWENRQMVSEKWVALSTQTNPAAKDYGYLWWRFDAPAPGLQGAFYAHGAGGQYLVVIPSLDMVVTRLGHSSPEINKTYFPRLVELILESVVSKSPRQRARR